MLRGIRKASANWLGRTVMGVVMTLLAGSFAIWGINDIFRGFGRNALAKIGDTEISADLFRQTYNDRVQQIGRQIGHPITPEEAHALGIDRQVLQQMIAEAGLDQIARKMRLAIANEQVSQRITTNPIFRGPNGEFDRVHFEQIIRSAGYTEQRFVAEQRQLILRRQISESVSGDVTVPRTWFDAINEFQNQERTIQYVALGPAQAGDIPQPTAEELNKYFEERKILFRAPEYRKIVTVAVLPAELAKSSEVSDEDIKRVYDQNVASYVTPERRHVEQMVFPSMEEAQAADERIKGGLTFAQLAAERGLKEQDIDLGTVPKSRIIDPAVADAAFSLKEGEVSAPVPGRFGVVLVTVLKIEPGETKPLAVVAPFIRNDIALERAKTQVQDIHDKMEDARAGGSTLEEAAQKLSLKVDTYDALDRSGRDPDGKLVTGLPDAGDVVAAAFSTEVGVDNDPVETEGGYVWYDVAAVTPAHDRTLDEVRSRVEDRWRDDQVASRLKAKAADLLDKLKAGTALDALAAADGLTVQTASDLKRGAPPNGIAAKMIDSVFRTPQDGFGNAQGDKPTDWIVFRVTEIKTPPLDPASTAGKELDQMLQRQSIEDLFSQYVAWMENYLGTSINQAVLAQALGTSAPENE